MLCGFEQEYAYLQKDFYNEPHIFQIFVWIRRDMYRDNSGYKYYQGTHVIVFHNEYTVDIIKSQMY